MELLSIGTLLAYTMVAISALVSRYEPGVQSVYDNTADDSGARTANWLLNLCSKSDQLENHDATLGVSQTTAYQPIMEETEELSNDHKDSKRSRKANESTSFCVKLSVMGLVAGIACLVIILTKSLDHISEGVWWAIFLICLSSGIIVVSLIAIQLQPRNSATFPFMVPGIPYISAVTIFINAALIANLQWMTYLRFGVWMTLGKLRDTYALLFSTASDCIAFLFKFIFLTTMNSLIVRSWIHYSSQSIQFHRAL